MHLMLISFKYQTLVILLKTLQKVETVLPQNEKKMVMFVSKIKPYYCRNRIWNLPL